MEALTIDLEDFENLETASFQGTYLIPSSPISVHYWYIHASVSSSSPSLFYSCLDCFLAKRLTQISFRESKPTHQGFPFLLNVCFVVLMTQLRIWFTLWEHPFGDFFYIVMSMHVRLFLKRFPETNLLILRICLRKNYLKVF